MTLPCLDCICVPICKSREYKELVSKCGIIESYLLATDVNDGKWHFPERMTELREFYGYE